MSRLLRAYNSALQRKPYLAGSASAAVLFGAGDVIAQQAIEKKGRQHDFIRTGRLAFYGGVIFSPVVTRWYQMLETIRLRSQPAVVAARVGLDQFVLTPPLLGVFFTTMSLMEGKGIDGAKDRISSQWWPTLQRNWALFLPVQILNFAVIPAHLRIVAVQIVSLGWNTYLSYANSQAAPKQDKVKELMQ